MGVIAAVDRTIKHLNLVVPGDVELVYQSVNSESEGIPRHPHVMPKTELEVIAGQLGLMLKQQAEGCIAKEIKMVLPVELRGAAKREEANPEKIDR